MGIGRRGADDGDRFKAVTERAGVALSMPSECVHRRDARQALTCEQNGPPPSQSNGGVSHGDLVGARPRIDPDQSRRSCSAGTSRTILSTSLVGATVTKDPLSEI